MSGNSESVKIPMVHCPFCRELQSGTLPDFVDADIESRILHEPNDLSSYPISAPLCLAM
jgi:hypothetical protein